jgi:hypothetical protein
MVSTICRLQNYVTGSLATAHGPASFLVDEIDCIERGLLLAPHACPESLKTPGGTAIGRFYYFAKPADGPAGLLVDEIDSTQIVAGWSRVLPKPWLLGLARLRKSAKAQQQEQDGA